MLYGNINELRDASVSLLEELSFLFNRLTTLKLDYPELRLYVWKSTLLFEVSGALTMVHENLSEIYFTPGRTNNRIRSPRLAASGQ